MAPGGCDMLILLSEHLLFRGQCGPSVAQCSVPCVAPACFFCCSNISFYRAVNCLNIAPNTLLIKVSSRRDSEGISPGLQRSRESQEQGAIAHLLNNTGTHGSITAFHWKVKLQ